MIRTRYIARLALHGHSAPDRESAFRARLANIDGMSITLDRPGIVAAGLGPAPIRIGEDGIILGSLFTRAHQRVTHDLSPAEQEQVAVSRGRHLVDTYWGPYVALLAVPEAGIAVVRAPWGDLPCYRLNTQSETYLASDIDLLMACADYCPAVDWNAVLAQIAHGPLHHERSCLREISQIPGGERLTLGPQGCVMDTLWSPWAFAARERQLSDPEQAAASIREQALGCIGARASQFDDILLTLSGGLDSSIVAACLADRANRFSAITLVTRDTIGDESHFATRVSNALGFPLEVSRREVEMLDIRQSGARGRPYPCVRGFFQESMRLMNEAAQRAGAQAIFNGAGGDNIFCSLQSGAPAADRLLTEGPGRGFLRTANDISQFAPASIPAVLRDALARAWFGRPPFRLAPRLELLSPKARTLIEDKPDHPWRIVPPGALPGKARHVWMLAHFKNDVESLDAQSPLPILSPLLSQPLVEACLAVPSWMWFEAGYNRMVARRAFSGLLPQDILRRRSKGTPDSFNGEIFERHRATMRTMLCEGELARHGLIDLPGALRILAGPMQPRDESFARLLYLVDVEAWASSWSGSGC